MLDSRASISGVKGFSLGAKFVGLTAGLILLLLLTAVISLRNSAETVRQIESVVDFAIPAYATLARSHIRSLEQAVELRRSLLLAEDPAVADEAITEHVLAFQSAQTKLQRELADAQQLLQSERDSTSSLSAASHLQKLSEALTGLKTLTDSYEKEASAGIASIQARALPEARQRLATIDRLRDELTVRLEAVRSGMRSVLETISKEAQASQARAQIATIVVFVLSSILGLSVAAFGAVRLIRAIQSIVRGAEAVEGGHLDTRIEIASRDEIGRLAASFNRMTEGLRMRDRIRDVFGKYVDRRIAEQLIESHTERGERREVAVMFCDFVGFTTLSHGVEAERLVQFLNVYFSLIARQIASTDGIIDKYIGDAVMAYWCPPFVPQEEVSLRSADAALLCLDQIPAMAAVGREIFDGIESFEPRIRIGIASGQSITGSIGAEERRNYTVIGDTVNLASRIEGANRVYLASNLVCGRTAQAIRAKFELREIDTLILPGIDVPQSVFEIVGRVGRISAEKQELRSTYERALAAYRIGDWVSARQNFSECLKISPEDQPARRMLMRVETLATTSGTANGWSGVWRLTKDGLL
jgi:class 3 adenylate cyclase